VDKGVHLIPKSIITPLEVVDVLLSVEAQLRVMETAKGTLAVYPDQNAKFLV